MRIRASIISILLSIQVLSQTTQPIAPVPVDTNPPSRSYGGILEPPGAGVLDGVYIPEHTPMRMSRKYQDLSINYHISELNDSVRFENLVKKAKYIQTVYSKNPLPIKNAVYFSQMSELVFDTLKYKNKFFLNEKAIKQHQDINTLICPNSLRFYCDSAWLEKDKEDSLSPWQMNARVSIPMENYLRPFYFSTHEVTNAEYREFVNWVRDSIARELLGELDEEKWWNKKDKNGAERQDGGHSLKWHEKLDYNDRNETVREVLNEIYFPQKTRFYSQKQFDTRKFNYTFQQNGWNKSLQDIVNVYPDTLSWVHDFAYAFQEPMTNHYFWHPAYNDYPVVGVSYPQVIAFLHWKTKMKQQELDTQGSKLKIEYDLPSEIEWEIVATFEKINGESKVFTNNYKYLCDDSWLTDLEFRNDMVIDTISYQKDSSNSGGVLAYPDKLITVSRRNLLSENIKRNFGIDNNLTADNSFHAFKTDLSKINSDKYDKKKKNSLLLSNLDANNISFMGGNVSEWLKESYSENWERIFNVRQELLSKIKGKDAKLLKELEHYYDSFNDRDGHLVRGANWYDERFSNKYGKNMAGMNTKIFVAKKYIDNDIVESYSTLGFRYVIHVTYIDKE